MSESPAPDIVASSELLARVRNTDIAVLLGEELDKATLLAALAARGELTQRLRGGRWLALEAARAGGASWAEIDAAEARWESGSAREHYERALALQRDYGLVDPKRCDPGPPELPAAPSPLADGGRLEPQGAPSDRSPQRTTGRSR